MLKIAILIALLAIVLFEYAETATAATWTSTGPEDAISNIVFSPNFAKDATIFAGNDKSAYKSTDNGTSWSNIDKRQMPGLPKLPARIGTNRAITSVGYSPAYRKDGTVFAVDSAGRPFKTANWGRNWSVIPKAPRGIEAVIISPDYARDVSAYFAAGSRLYRLDAKKLQWILVRGLPAGAAPRTLTFSPYYAKDKIAFIHSEQAIFRSVKHVGKWTKLTGNFGGGAITALAVSPNFRRDRTVIAATKYRGLFRSRDAGYRWAEAPSPNSGSTTYNVFVSPGYVADGTLFTSTATGLYRSNDRGASWYPSGFQDFDLGASFKLLYSPDYVRDRTIIAATADNQIYGSEDRGLTWIKRGAPALNNPSVGTYIKDIAISPDFAYDGTLLLAARTYDSENSIYQPGLHVSIDRGYSWRALEMVTITEQVQAVAISPDYANDETMMVATREHIYKSTNGGDSWELADKKVNLASDPIINTSAIRFSPNYANDKTIFISTNAHDLEPYNLNNRTIVLAGLYKSTDGGASWRSVHNGNNQLNQAVTISGVAFSPDYKNDSMLFVVTGLSGGGVIADSVYGDAAGVAHFGYPYESRDGGNTWINVWQNASPSLICDIDVTPEYPSGTTVFAANGQGILMRRQ